MKRTISTILLMLVLASLPLSACGSQTAAPSVSTPSGAFDMPIDENLDDVTVNVDGSEDCKPGSVRMIDQHVIADSSYAFEEVAENPIGVERVHASLNMGVFTLKLRPLAGPECVDGGPASGTITVDFVAEYRADVDRSLDPVCVFRSRVDFSQFNIRSSPQPVDNYVLEKAKGKILAMLDARVAAQLNQLFFGTERDPNADVRCDWSELPG